MPLRHPLFTAWLALAILGIGTTLVTLWQTPLLSRAAVTGLVLVLAGLKARVILARYLGLAASPFWTRTFDLVIALFLLAAFAIYSLGGAT